MICEDGSARLSHHLHLVVWIIKLNEKIKNRKYCWFAAWLWHCDYHMDNCSSESNMILLAPDGGSSQTHLFVPFDLKYDLVFCVARLIRTKCSDHVSLSASSCCDTLMRLALLLCFGVYPSSVVLSKKWNFSYRKIQIGDWQMSGMVMTDRSLLW